MIRGCPDDGKTRREIDSCIKSQSLEGNKSLIMVHGQNSIEIILLMGTEESVRGIGSEGQNILVVRLLYCRIYHIYLLASEHTSVP